MKRVLSLVFMMMMVISPLTCGETPIAKDNLNLAEMTIDEIIELRRRLDEELFARGNMVVLSEGEYAVGTDIAEGTYTITDYSDPEEDSRQGWNIYVYKSPEAVSEYERAEKEYREKSSAAAYSRSQGTYDPKDAPESVAESDFRRHFELRTNASASFSLSSGELLVVQRVISKGTLTIGKSAGLFME